MYIQRNNVIYYLLRNAGDRHRGGRLLVWLEERHISLVATYRENGECFLSHRQSSGEGELGDYVGQGVGD